MLFASIAVLTLLIGFAEGQGRLQNLPQSVPRNLQSSAASKNFQANPPSRSTSQVQSFQKNLIRAINYPNWDTWKKMYGKSYSPSEERPAKHRYLMNVMHVLEQSYQNFNYNLGVGANADGGLSKISNLVPSYSQPIFSEFVQLFKKNYSSAAQKAYRKKVYEKNVKILPGIFYWSDWTPEEFDNLLPVNLLTYKDGDKIWRKIGRVMLEGFREQSQPGTQFNKTLKRIDVNLFNKSQSLVELVSATTPIQQLGSKARKIIPIQDFAQIQSFQQKYSQGSKQQGSKTQNARSQKNSYQGLKSIPQNQSYQGFKQIPQSKASLPQRRFQNKAPTQLGSNLQNPNLIPKQYLQNQFDSQTKINTVPTIPTTPQVPFSSTPPYTAPYTSQLPFPSSAPSPSPYPVPYVPPYTAPYTPPYVAPSVPPYGASPTPYPQPYSPAYNPLPYPTTGIQPNYFKL